MKDFKLNQKGAALIQVMLAAAVMSVLAATTMRISDSLNSQDRAMPYKHNLEGLATLVAATVSDTTLCRREDAPAPFTRGIGLVGAFNAANAATPNGIDLEIRLPQYLGKRLTRTASAAQRTLDDLNLIINSVTFNNAVALPIDPSSPTITTYEGDLDIFASAAGGAIVPSMNRKVAKIRMNIVTATGTFVGCMLSASAAELCERLGGNYVPDATPSCRFGIANVDRCPVGEYIKELEFTSGGTNRTCASSEIRCPPNQFLLGIGNNTGSDLNLSGTRITCLLVCPPPFVGGGAGQAHATIGGCNCPNAGDVFDGTSCGPAAPVCSLPFIVGGAGQPHATIPGCACPIAGQIFNGTSCVMAFFDPITCGKYYAKTWPLVAGANGIATTPGGNEVDAEPYPGGCPAGSYNRAGSDTNIGGYDVFWCIPGPFPNTLCETIGPPP